MDKRINTGSNIGTYLLSLFKKYQERDEKLARATVIIEPEKCCNNVPFTGHNVVNRRVKMGEDKLERIKNADRPKAK